MRKKALHSTPEGKAADIGGLFAALGICTVVGGASWFLMIASWNLLV